MGNKHQEKTSCISSSLKDYLALVDETGRIIRDDKRGAVPIFSFTFVFGFHWSMLPLDVSNITASCSKFVYGRTNISISICFFPVYI